ncbi:hypothetical protein [Loigolactobacillus zhaoyuanensis]|uniref:Uncharacterized protein n=1 Tax=Loigolactobacillus zhaoyuanensis TaxID=2486017 RepID=A0ABW8U959_9LACO|nr:hypothetical protein [Loigolactobacillus zhaoyuanensis]
MKISKLITRAKQHKLIWLAGCLVFVVVLVMLTSYLRQLTSGSVNLPESGNWEEVEMDRAYVYRFRNGKIYQDTGALNQIVGSYTGHGNHIEIKRDKSFNRVSYPHFITGYITADDETWHQVAVLKGTIVENRKNSLAIKWTTYFKDGSYDKAWQDVYHYRRVDKHGNYSK